MILSISSSIATRFTSSIPPRVSASVSTSKVYFSENSGGGGIQSRTSCLCFSKIRETAVISDEKKISSRSSSVAAEAVASGSDQLDAALPRTFLDARSEQDLILVIRKEAEAGRLPKNVAQGMEELYHNYRNAVFLSESPEADERVLSNMAVVLDRIFMDVRDPFEFPPYHEAIREPFDYYTFGQNYIRQLVDFRTSVVGNISIFSEIEKKLQEGDNVIFISNHQTEADPAVIALMLESTHPHLAENLIYVAGDRVVTDPLCKPFSMGRNLLCVYSKKHMTDDPELIEMKKKANAKSLKEMALLLRTGSKVIWIAPSGGRDRPDPVTEEWFPAPFDASSVDNMRRLTDHAGKRVHLYPLAVSCYDIMPPPAEVEKDIGEKRVLSFHGVGISVGPEISYQEIAAAFRSPKEAKETFVQSLYSSVSMQYNVLKSALHGRQGLKASTPTVSLSQPWK